MDARPGLTAAHQSVCSPIFALLRSGRPSGSVQVLWIHVSMYVHLTNSNPPRWHDCCMHAQEQHRPAGQRSRPYASTRIQTRTTVDRPLFGYLNHRQQHAQAIPCQVGSLLAALVSWTSKLPGLLLTIIPQVTTVVDYSLPHPLAPRLCDLPATAAGNPISWDGILFHFPV
jgi:hypothetical protein